MLPINGSGTSRCIRFYLLRQLLIMYMQKATLHSVYCSYSTKCSTLEYFRPLPRTPLPAYSMQQFLFYNLYVKVYNKQECMNECDQMRC